MKILTLYYSNYSGNCKALLQYLKTIKITNHIPIKFINIDNSEIKKAVERKFMSVPALIVIENENISLYTGENVFEWFSSEIASLNPPETVGLGSESPEPVQREGPREASDAQKELEAENINVMKRPIEVPIENKSSETRKTATELAAEISKDREHLLL